MKIGIIVHSKTGNTYSVAEHIVEKLLAAGHLVTLEQVIALNDEEIDVKKIQLNTAPDVGAYDALILGAPVRAFSLSSVMKAYLAQAVELNGKKVICYVTEFFPYSFMGGNRAISEMKAVCESKGSRILGTGVVNWLGLNRKKKIADLVEGFCKML